MEQEGDGGGGDVNKKPQPQPQPQPPPPQTCPRCESVNTKFCYYNNYSLSQPRYFCKTCRRYWTQGGALRNVPVGGGCRKGKRAKTSSSSQLQPPPQEAVVQAQRNLTRTTVIRPKDPPSALGSPSPSPATDPSILPYPHVGGYLSSLAAIQSLNPSQPFNPSLNLGADAVGSGSGSSNLGLLSGFNAASLGSQRQIRPSEIFQMENREREIESLYRAEQGSASHHGWSQSFINNASHTALDASLWCTMSTSSIGDTSGINNNNTGAGSSSVIPNQWPDLPGFCPPP